MRYWLYKSEPGDYSIDDLERDGTTVWDGVRNFMARNYLMQAAVDDLAFFYHSSANPPGVAGLARVTRTNVVDLTQFDPASKYHDATSDPDRPRWMTVEVGFAEKFGRLVPLIELRRRYTPEQLPILRQGSRLSVTPVPNQTAESLLILARSEPAAG